VIIMENIHVLFAIRLRSDEVMAVVADRAGRVLNCRFVASQHPVYADEMIMEAETACLRIRIERWPFYGDPKLRVYQLRGENVLEPPWDFVHKIDLSDWMLQEFLKRDSPDWYIATLEEIKKEAGIE
jgi:hypothetical protein